MTRDMRESFSTRERRYPIRIDVRYRLCGDRDWCVGRTENISRRGILIRTGSVTIPPLTRIEILLALPPEVGGAPGTPVIGRGLVVRTEPAQHEAADAAMAATIVEYVAPILEYVAASVADADPRRI